MANEITSLFLPSLSFSLFLSIFLSQPGDRVQIIGNYRCLPSKRSGYTTGTFRTVLLATNVITLSKEVAPLFSGRDVAKIKRFSRSKQYDPFEMLAHSLAPSIHGHDHIKKAVLCMLLGGVEKILENGTRLRGWVQGVGGCVIFNLTAGFETVGQTTSSVVWNS